MAAAASLVHVGDIPKDIVYGIVNELWETQGYREAHDFLRRYVNPATLDRVSIFEVLLFIALNPAIPSFNVPEDTEICWQHIQPVWRYAQCVAWVQANGWPFDETNPESAIERICRDLKFYPISRRRRALAWLRSKHDQSIIDNIKYIKFALGGLPEEIVGVDILDRRNIPLQATQVHEMFWT